MRPLRALSVLMLACASPTLAADKLPPLDAEFLEYLASFGGDEADWALFADDDEPAAKPPARDQAAPTPASERDESKTEAAVKSAEKR
jgi:hypothetical protein